MSSENKYLIELSYDDQMVAEAEHLFEKKAIIDIHSPEKNLFLFLVHDKTDREVEIFKPFTKVQKSTCSCPFHQKHKICKHVIAGLFLLRDQKKKEKIKEKQGDIIKIKTLSTRTILQFVDREELIDFVQHYAKSDPSFALQLKIHFAKKVDMQDNREKYKMLLDTIIKPYTGQNKPGAAMVKAFLQVSEELVAQVYDCLAIQNFEEALSITEAGFSKCCYVRHYFGMESPAFTRHFQMWHSLTESFLQQKIPFNLKKRLLTFLSELVCTSYYRHTETDANLLRIIHEHGSRQVKSKLVSILLEKKYALTDEEKAVFYAFICVLAGKIPPAVRQIIQKPGFHLVSFYNHLMKAGLYEMVLAELESGSDMPGFYKDKNFILSKLYISKKLWEKALNHVLLYFSNCGDLSLFHEIKMAAGKEQWKDELYPALLKKMKGDVRLKPMFMGQFLQSENDWNQLLSLLYSSDDIHLLLAFAPQLYKIKQVETEILFSEHIVRFLENHLGDIVQNYLKYVFENIEKLKLFSIKKPIQKLLRQKFADRQSIQLFLDSYN